MRYWRAVNLTPTLLEVLVSRLDWADHSEICEVRFKEPRSNDTETMAFQSGKFFVCKYILPKGIKVESGEEKTTYLTNSISPEVIKEGEASDFMVLDLDEQKAQKAASIIAWYLLNNCLSPLPLYSIKHQRPAEGLQVRLFHQKDITLLEKLVAEGFQVGYQDFDWTPYYPQKGEQP